MLNAQYDTIPLHIRGGSVIPMQESYTTTAQRYENITTWSIAMSPFSLSPLLQSLKNPFTLLMAPDSTGYATGNLYMDDGESLSTSDYTLLQFTLMINQVRSNAILI